MNFKRQYITNEKNQKIAVQLDIATFEKIESILENYALFEYMQEEDEILDEEAAKNYYASLKKSL
jgi:hypothetical protein